MSGLRSQLFLPERESLEQMVETIFGAGIFAVASSGSRIDKLLLLFSRIEDSLEDFGIS